MIKSPDAFRTISEVSDLLETPAHVLRFWESRFPQIRPVKRAGGRRYYRPADVALLTGIKRLLHDDGMTIRGVQKILREQGVRHVSGVSDDSADAGDDSDLAEGLAAEPAVPKVPETAKIIPMQAPPRAAVPPPEPEMAQEDGADDQPLGHAPAEFAATDDGAEDALPADPQPAVAEPPPPVMARAPISAPVSAPVVADLFARPAPAPLPPADDPVTEAPMAVWAEEAETDSPLEEQGQTGAAVIPMAPLGADAPATAPADPPLADPGPTLAQKLRALSVADLSQAERQHVAQIRDQAIALRARLSGPARTQG